VGRLRFVGYAAVIAGAWLAASHFTALKAARGSSPRAVRLGRIAAAAEAKGPLREATVARVQPMPGGQACWVVLKLVEGGVGSDGRRYLTMVIGNEEAAAIERERLHMAPPRPLTHDLLRDAIERMGGAVKRVAVTRVQNNTFFGAITLDVSGREVVIDSRPSDSIALAVRTGSPIFVSEEVMMKAGEAEAPWGPGEPGGGGDETPEPELRPGGETI